MNRIQIIYETYKCNNSTKNENDKKSMLIYLTQKWMKKKREKEEIQIKDTSDSEWYRFSLVSIRCWIIQQSETLKEIFSRMEKNKRGNERNNKENAELRKQGK